MNLLSDIAVISLLKDLKDNFHEMAPLNSKFERPPVSSGLTSYYVFETEFRNITVLVRGMRI